MSTLEQPAAAVNYTAPSQQATTDYGVSDGARYLSKARTLSTLRHADSSAESVTVHARSILQACFAQWQLPAEDQTAMKEFHDALLAGDLNRFRQTVAAYSNSPHDLVRLAPALKAPYAQAKVIKLDFIGNPFGLNVEVSRRNSDVVIGSGTNGGTYERLTSRSNRVVYAALEMQVLALEAAESIIESFSSPAPLPENE